MHFYILVGARARPPYNAPAMSMTREFFVSHLSEIIRPFNRREALENWRRKVVE